MAKDFLCSYFDAPITNKMPHCTVSGQQLAQAVRSTWLKPQTEALHLISDKAQARSYKGYNFPYITPAGTFRYCNDQSLLSWSNMLGVDLDHVGDVERLKLKLIADPHFRTLMAFRSPSGDGLKWFLEIDLSLCSYRQWFDAVRHYLLSPMSGYGLSSKQCDSSVRNESHACFLCYDPDLYSNFPAPDDNDNDSDTAGTLTTMFDPMAWLTPAAVKPAPTTTPTAWQSASHTDELAMATATVRELIARGANIAESYDDYVRLGFSLAQGLGSDGHDLYHTLCAASTKYRRQHCERQWQECLRKGDGRTTIATFYHMARQAGVDLSATHRHHHSFIF